MLGTKKINNLKVNVYKPKVEKQKKIQGSEIVGTNLYWNCCLIAQKNSGKSNLIWNILERTASKKTTLIFFVGTINQDDTYIAMIKHFQEKGITCITHDSIFIDKVNLLDIYIKKFKEVAMVKKQKEEKMGIDADEIKTINVDDPDDDIIEYKKEKKQSCETIMIFDDLADQVKHLESISKIHRHLHVSILTATQYIHDLSKAFFLQQNFIILFPNFSIEKLKILYDNVSLKMTFEQLIEMYNYATKEPYNFLFIDRSNDQIRRNFDELLFFQ